MNRRTPFTAFAKAQALGLALGLASALWALMANGHDLRLFLVASGAAWLAWEFFLGPRAPSHRTDARALAYGLASGVAFPWVGLALTALARWAQP